MKSRCLATVALVACARASTPLVTNVASPATAADPVGCSEARLRALAEQFPAAKLDIEIDARGEPDPRGFSELPCPIRETDDACLTRARQQIPRGFVELSEGASGIDGAVELEVTFEVDGQVRTERSLFNLMVEVATGRHVTVISEREIPTPENRRASVAYGYQRPHREATLVFPWLVERDVATLEQHLRTRETQLGLRRRASYHEDVVGTSRIRLHARYTCESYNDPTVH